MLNKTPENPRKAQKFGTRRDSAAQAGAPREHVAACPPHQWYRQRAPIRGVRGHSRTRGMVTDIRGRTWRTRAWWDIRDACPRAPVKPVVSATRTRPMYSLERPERLEKTSRTILPSPPRYARGCTVPRRHVAAHIETVAIPNARRAEADLNATRDAGRYERCSAGRSVGGRS